MCFYSAGAAITPEAESLHPQPSTCAYTTVGTLGKICLTQLTLLEITTEKGQHCCYFGSCKAGDKVTLLVELRLENYVTQKCAIFL